jgi:hypothetical protein
MQGLHSLNARTLEACCIQAIGFGRSLAITKLRWVMGVLRGRELVALDGRNGSGGPRHVSGLRLPASPAISGRLTLRASALNCGSPYRTSLPFGNSWKIWKTVARKKTQNLRRDAFNQTSVSFGRHLYLRDALFISGSFASGAFFAHSCCSLKYIVPMTTPAAFLGRGRKI